MTDDQYLLTLTAFQGRLAMAKHDHLPRKDIYKALRLLTLTKLKEEIGL
tara:strand:+ start:1532 stop:1678 length:147 start_codon:yes stop_codon:yes gene_type:complete